MTKESYVERKPDCEYFCRNCLQLRLSYLIRTHKCANCQSTNIIRGKPGSLDKDQLKKQYQFINLLDKCNGVYNSDLNTS
jgi:hypothetical protein